MNVFEWDMEATLVAQVCVFAEARYPAECCGVILGYENTKRVAEFVALGNTAADGTKRCFRVSELEYIDVLSAGRTRGLRPMAFFHSHPDASAELSHRDLKELRVGGLYLFPGQLQVVVSVKNGQTHAINVYRYSEESRGFDTQNIPVLKEIPRLPS
jgi:proteasome lid subunit RPN8/RPN11